MNFIAEVLAAIGMSVANTGVQGCFLWVMDEPKTPECLIIK